MIKKLNVVGGIIKDKTIGNIPFNLDIVKPKGKRNVRTMKPMKKVIGITNHNTANTSPTAGDEKHAEYLQKQENLDKQYVSVHFFVDEDSITQTVPITEITWHAGDGVDGKGNTQTISIEICENGNLEKAIQNAQILNACLIKTYPELKVYKHQDWSGKYCPRKILDIPNGWEDFVNGIYKLVQETPKTAWEREVEEAVNWALENHISDGTRLDDKPTRKELIVMLKRFYDL